MGWTRGKGRPADSRLTRTELAREYARDGRRRQETSGRWSPLYPRSSQQRGSLLGYARAPSLASVHQCSQITIANFSMCPFMFALQLLVKQFWVS